MHLALRRPDARGFLVAVLTVPLLSTSPLAAAPVGGASPEEEAAPVTTLDAEVAFDRMMDVVAHRRCLNCHPSGDHPRQGEDRRVHRFGVQRGPDGHGTAALRCSTCHQDRNHDHSGVPGAPHWHLAPRSMGWEGLGRVEIARAMLDPERNGGRTFEEIERHLTGDALVLWAFEPGVDHEGRPREAPPVSEEHFVAAVRSWFAAGAPLPQASADPAPEDGRGE